MLSGSRQRAQIPCPCPFNFPLHGTSAATTSVRSKCTSCCDCEMRQGSPDPFRSTWPQYTCNRMASLGTRLLPGIQQYNERLNFQALLLGLFANSASSKTVEIGRFSAVSKRPWTSRVTIALQGPRPQHKRTIEMVRKNVRSSLASGSLNTWARPVMVC